MLLFAAGLSYSQQWNAKDLVGRETYMLSLDSQPAKAITDKLGYLHVAYSFNGVCFRNSSAKYVNGYDMAFIFAVKGTTLSILGRIDKQAVTDAKGNVLFELKKTDPKLSQHVVGVSSNILKKPLQPVLVAQDIDDPEKYYETPVICSLSIDVAKKTLVLAKK
jgi:hypothetical protein